MAKRIKEPKQRDETEDVYEVEAIVSHRKVSIRGHSRLITERYFSFLWFIHIVSVCNYIMYHAPRYPCCKKGWMMEGRTLWGRITYYHMHFLCTV